MSEHEPTELSEELTPAELAALDAFLSEPAVWDEPDPALEDDVVAAVLATAAAEAPAPAPAQPEPAPAQPEPAPAQPEPAPAPASEQVVPLRRRRTGRDLALMGAAAAVALLVILTVSAVRGASDRSGETLLALGPPAGAAAPLAPGASGEARIDERGDGTRIRLDVRGLPPAPPGSYYEAWMRKDPQVGVSAGTFHLREGGQETIELWSGVSPADFPLFTITIQEEARPESSGKVLLAGRLS